MENLNFSQALEYIKKGFKLARAGWNGKGMFVLKAGGYSVASVNLREGTKIDAAFLESRGVTEMVILPHIDMWTADNKYVSGWVTSQTDLFAEDWMVLDAVQGTATETTNTTGATMGAVTA